MEEKGGQSRSPNRSESSLASSTQIYAANIKKLTDDFESIVKMTTSELEVEQRRVDEERKALQREKEKFEKDRRDAEEIFDSFLSALFSGRHPLTFDKKGRVFLDRNPEFFGIILDFLRTGYMQKFSSHQKQDRLEIELEFFGIDLTPQIRKLFEGDREFVYESHMDNKGLFYYLGTLNRDTWSSPVGKVKVEASTQGGSNLISIFDRVGESSVENLFSAPGPQWLSVSLERGALCPTGYWLKQENQFQTVEGNSNRSEWLPFADDRYLRNWEFQGATSTDRNTWVTIVRYENDKTTDSKNLSRYWPVETTTRFQAFRIYVYGASEKVGGSPGHCDFSIQQLELYGFYREKDA